MKKPSFYFTNIYCKAFFTVIVFLFFSNLLFAQKDYKRLERANALFNDYSYIQAIAEYEKLLKKNNLPEAQIKLAECYRLIRKMPEAESWYNKAATAEAIDSIYLYHFASVLKYNKKYEEAKKWYLKYETFKQDGNGAKQAKFLDLIYYFVRDSSKVAIKNMAFNSENADFSTAFFKDGLLFSSTRTKGKNSGGLDQWTGENYNDIYFIEKINIDSSSKAKLLAGFINSNFHEGPTTFDKTNNTIYFTRNSVEKGLQKRSKEGVLKIQIYKATFKDNRWDVIESFSLNNPEFVFCHPSISADGNRIYFASDINGGFGGLDIYYAEKSGNGWGTPVNLGNQVNTQWNDMFPYIHSTGTLYFASEGLPGLGGLDVYSVRFDGSAWSDVKNLGYPINTSKDDFSFILDSTNKSGYVSSNRDGGKGSDDIYSVFIKDTYFEEGVLLAVEDDTTSQQEESNDFDMLQPLNNLNATNSETKKDTIAGLPVNDLDANMEEALARKMFKPDYAQEEELAKKVMIDEKKPSSNNNASNKDVTSINTTTNDLNDNTLNTNNTKSNTKNKTITTTNKPDIIVSETTKKQVVNMKDAKGRLVLEKADENSKAKKVNGLIFRVQLGAYAKPLNKTPEAFFKTPVETYNMGDNITRYVTPLTFNNISSAETHKKQFISKGIKDAWIVPFYNGNRITVEQAVELLNK